MRWLSRQDRKVKKVIAQKDWHEWYAWYPVKLSSNDKWPETVWLEKIYRRRRWPLMSAYSDYDIAVSLIKKESKPWRRPTYEYKELTQLMIDAGSKK